MKTLIAIENLKCSGCAGSIKKGLRSFSELEDVKVDLDQETVEVSYTDALSLNKIKEKLASMGYPERGTKSGLGKLAANAKSYVSCAIGKLSNEEQDDKL
jgi:copper chaperone